MGVQEVGCVGGLMVQYASFECWSWSGVDCKGECWSNESWRAPIGELARCMPYRPQVTVGVGSVGVVRKVRGEGERVGGLGSWGQGAVGGWRQGGVGEWGEFSHF